jgi:hypothetical protein
MQKLPQKELPDIFLLQKSADPHWREQALPEIFCRSKTALQNQSCTRKSYVL